MRRLTVIADLQFGSCGKGLFAGHLALGEAPDCLITAWAPNAGHTFVDKDGNKFVNIALPSGIVSPSVKTILLGPGSVINPDQLSKEIEDYGNLGMLEGKRILLHENAAVVTPKHREEEAQYGAGIGSTMKGAGAALISKIRRDVKNLTVVKSFHPELFHPNIRIVNQAEYNRAVDEADYGVIEGAQGFSLGINNGFYPFTTSRECTVAQMLSDCAIPLRSRNRADYVIGVARTFPIRVANRFDDKGNQIGWSGPCYDDQIETTWTAIGQKTEYTTVTKLPRRVFTWSEEQVHQAIRMNSVDEVFLNFANYVDSPGALAGMIDSIHRQGIAFVGSLGYGPSINDIKPLVLCHDVLNKCRAGVGEEGTANET